MPSIEESTGDTAPIRANEVEIAYSEQNTVDKLLAYQLRPESLFRHLLVDIDKLENIDLPKEQVNDFLMQLKKSLETWTSPTDLGALTKKINFLIYLWLNAIDDGTSIQTIKNILRCFRIKALFSKTVSLKFQLFLFDILAETTHQHHRLNLDYSLNFDTNTQLPNSSQLLRDLEQIKPQEKAKSFAIFAIQFQPARSHLVFSKLAVLEINRAISSMLEQNLSPDHQLYFSGDLQFDILISNTTNKTQLNLLAVKISRIFEHMVFFNNQSVLATPFIGCSAFNPKLPGVKELYNQSKIALDSAVDRQESLVIYSAELEKQLAQQRDTEYKVLEAFAGDNLTLFFQPIINIETNQCIGAELLLRWSEKYGLSIHPTLTVEILNKVGKGKLFTRWLINSACRYAKELIHDHQLNIYLTVNLRAEDLYDADLPHLLKLATEMWKLSPNDIVLEITEDGILQYNESSTSVIQQLTEQGFKFAIDDFGTGHSSMARLKNMPIHLIKIDQSFVRNIATHKDDREIVQSITSLAKSLDKDVLAEGVENEVCLAEIKAIGIKKCQGYYFAKPLPLEEFIAWAKAR